MLSQSLFILIALAGCATRVTCATARNVRTVVMVVGEMRSMADVAGTWDENLITPMDAAVLFCPAMTRQYPDAGASEQVLMSIPGMSERLIGKRVYDSEFERDTVAHSPLINHTCESRCDDKTETLALPSRFLFEYTGYRGKNMDQFKNLYTCYDELLRYEKRTGITFDVIVKLRTDLALWTPIHSADVDAVLKHVPEGRPAAIFKKHTMLDWEGIEDHFWIANHAGAEIVMTAGLVSPRFNALQQTLAGRILNKPRYFCDVNISRGENNAERIVLDHLLVHNASIHRASFMDYNSMIDARSGCARYRLHGIHALFATRHIDPDVFKYDPLVDCDTCCDWFW